MNTKLIVFSILTISVNLFCSIKSRQNDTVFFDEAVNLKIITQEADSIKFYTKHSFYPNPFSPTQKDFAAKIVTELNAKVIITILDKEHNTLKIFCWEKLPAGVYAFYWWDYLNILSTGVYYLKKNINGISEIKNSYFIK